MDSTGDEEAFMSSRFHCPLFFLFSIMVATTLPNVSWASPGESSVEAAPVVVERDRLRIQAHLAVVEETLRQREVPHLSSEQRRERQRNLERLRAYRVAGEFPRNTHVSWRQPVFIDRDGRPCAVGHLMIESGWEEAAAQIATRENLAYLPDMRSPAVEEWVAHSGLSAEEAAWIQPAYSPTTYRRLHITLDDDHELRPLAESMWRGLTSRPYRCLDRREWHDDIRRRKRKREGKPEPSDSDLRTRGVVRIRFEVEVQEDWEEGARTKNVRIVADETGEGEKGNEKMNRCLRDEFAAVELSLEAADASGKGTVEAKFRYGRTASSPVSLVSLSFVEPKADAGVDARGYPLIFGDDS